MTDEERRQHDRDRSRRYYYANRQKAIAARLAYKRRKYATSPEYRQMQQACVRRWATLHLGTYKANHRSQRSKRRARKTGAMVTRVNRERAFEFAGGICGICRLPIDSISPELRLLLEERLQLWRDLYGRPYRPRSTGEGAAQVLSEKP